MRVWFNKNEIYPELPGIILLSHGALAMGMLDTIRIVLGDTRNIAVFALEPGDDPAGYRDAFLEAVEAYSAGSVIFVDMFGGSPCNQLLLAWKDQEIPCCAFSGMSLPLISEAISARPLCSGEALRSAIREIIPYTVMDLNDVMDDLDGPEST